MKKFTLFFLLALLLNITNAQNLYLNEFLASNDANYYDSTTGKYPDWIEIYNSDNLPIDIGGMYITDDLSNLTIWQIPTTYPDSTTIPANGFIVLFADKIPVAGVLHVNIKLSGDGEQIGLTASDGTTIIDSVSFGPQETDISMGRIPNGVGDWVTLPSTSMGLGNEYLDVDENQNPAEYFLSQNYPNPFNPSTEISYYLPKSDFVTIKVHDVLGKEIAVLVNQIQNAGNHRVNFNAKNLTSGVYFYVFQSSNIDKPGQVFSETKKMVLIK